MRLLRKCFVIWEIIPNFANKLRKGMKRLFIVIMACVALSMQAQENSSSTSNAEEPIAQVLRFGYLSYDSVLVSMPDYALMKQQLADLRKAFDDEMKRVEEEFNRKYEDFLEGQKDFPRTILLKRQTELQELLQRNLEFKRQGLAELEQCEREMTAPLRAQLNEAIATVAREKKLALVINTDANACPFIEPSMGEDVTEVVKQLLSK